MVFLLIGDVKVNTSLIDIALAKLVIKSSDDINVTSISSMNIISINNFNVIEFNRTCELILWDDELRLEFKLLLTDKSIDTYELGIGLCRIESSDNNTTKIISLYDEQENKTASISFTVFYKHPQMSSAEKNIQKLNIDSNYKTNQKEFLFLLKRKSNWSSNRPVSFNYEIERDLDKEMQLNHDQLHDKSRKSMQSSNLPSKSKKKPATISLMNRNKPMLRQTQMKVGYIGSKWPEVTLFERERALNRLFLAEERKLQSKLAAIKEIRQKNEFLKIKSYEINKSNEMKKAINLANLLDKKQYEVEQLRRQLIHQRKAQSKVNAIISDRVTADHSRNSKKVNEIGYNNKFVEKKPKKRKSKGKLHDLNSKSSNSKSMKTSRGINKGGDKKKKTRLKISKSKLDNITDYTEKKLHSSDGKRLHNQPLNQSRPSRLVQLPTPLYEIEKNRDTYNQDRYDQDRYDQDRYDQEKYDQDTYDQVEYDQNRYDQEEYDQERYDQEEYDQDRYDQEEYDQEKYIDVERQELNEGVMTENPVEFYYGDNSEDNSDNSNDTDELIMQFSRLFSVPRYNSSKEKLGTDVLSMLSQSFASSSPLPSADLISPEEQSNFHSHYMTNSNSESGYDLFNNIAGSIYSSMVDRINEEEEERRYQEVNTESRQDSKKIRDIYEQSYGDDDDSFQNDSDYSQEEINTSDDTIDNSLRLYSSQDIHSFPNTVLHSSKIINQRVKDYDVFDSEESSSAISVSFDSDYDDSDDVIQSEDDFIVNDGINEKHVTSIMSPTDGENINETDIEVTMQANERNSPIFHYGSSSVLNTSEVLKTDSTDDFKLQSNIVETLESKDDTITVNYDIDEESAPVYQNTSNNSTLTISDENSSEINNYSEIDSKINESGDSFKASPSKDESSVYDRLNSLIKSAAATLETKKSKSKRKKLNKQ